MRIREDYRATGDDKRREPRPFMGSMCWIRFLLEISLKIYYHNMLEID
jgi:hypothetical protein